MAMAAHADPISKQIYLSSKCSLQFQKKRYVVIATEKIDIGELLLIDHCYYTTGFHALSEMKIALMFQPELYDAMLPASPKWKVDWITSDAGAFELAKAAAELKLLRHAVRSDNSIYLGATVHRFRMSKKRGNAHTFVTTIATNHHIPMDCRFLRMVATRVIHPGEEIRIATSKGGTRSSLDWAEWLALRMIRKYMSTRDFTFVTMNQVCNCVGRFRYGHVDVSTAEFADYLQYSGAMDERFENICDEWSHAMFTLIFLIGNHAYDINT